MGYIRLADNESFSDKYNTYILGYCPDGGGVWFASNERHFYYEYPKEFNTKAEAIAFFKQNLDFFFDLSLSLGNNGALHLLDTHESYERNKDYDYDLFYDLFNDVVQYCLDEGTGIEYEEGINFTTEKEIREHGSKKLRYVDWGTICGFLSPENIDYTKYVIQKRKAGDVEGTRLLAYDEWRIMCQYFNRPEMTFEDATNISNTLYKYDIEVLDFMIGDI